MLHYTPSSSPCWAHKAMFYGNGKRKKEFWKQFFFFSPICHFSVCKTRREAWVHGLLKTTFFFTYARRKYFFPQRASITDCFLGWGEISGSHRRAICVWLLLECSLKIRANSNTTGPTGAASANVPATIAGGLHNSFSLKPSSLKHLASFIFPWKHFKVFSSPCLKAAPSSFSISPFWEKIFEPDGKGKHQLCRGCSGQAMVK